MILMKTTPSLFLLALDCLGDCWVAGSGLTDPRQATSTILGVLCLRTHRGHAS